MKNKEKNRKIGILNILLINCLLLFGVAAATQRFWGNTEVRGNMKVIGASYTDWYIVPITGTNAIIDFNKGNKQFITLTDNIHLWATNINAQDVILRVAQDGGGSKLLSYDTKFDPGTNALLSLTSTGGEEDILSIIGIDSDRVYYRITTGGFTP